MKLLQDQLDKPSLILQAWICFGGTCLMGNVLRKDLAILHACFRHRELFFFVYVLAAQLFEWGALTQHKLTQCTGSRQNEFRHGYLLFSIQAEDGKVTTEATLQISFNRCVLPFEFMHFNVFMYMGFIQQIQSKRKMILPVATSQQVKQSISSGVIFFLNKPSYSLFL